MKLTRDELKRLLPEASDALLDANAQDPGEITELECDNEASPRAAPQRTYKMEGKFLVRITSFRKRLLDEDNLCGKFYCDMLRYCGAIPGDAPQQTSIETRQSKIGSKENEEILVEVFRLQ